MKWVHFTKLNGSVLCLRIEDIYKVVKARNTGYLHIYTVQGITYECEGMAITTLFNLLEEDK